MATPGGSVSEQCGETVFITAKGLSFRELLGKITFVLGFQSVRNVDATRNRILIVAFSRFFSYFLGAPMEL